MCGGVPLLRLRRLLFPPQRILDRGASLPLPLALADLPEGNWYCPSCTCRICQELVDDRKHTSSSDAMKCLQCHHKYHKFCLKEMYENRATADGRFCGESCQEVYSLLHSRIGVMNHIADGYSWILLRCFHDDLKFPSATKFAFKAECNSKLAVALSLMEECFMSMVDPRTGIDMIPHVLYNWRSDFARLNFDNFYTVVLENDDVLIAAASIRVHGVAVAEMPLIATCSKYRRQGMCRRLMTAIEELLLSIKVEKLVIAAIPELVETWTKGFGFQVLENDEKQTLNKINLMVFPGTVLLKKTLFTKPDLQPAVICCGLEAEESAQVCCGLGAEGASMMQVETTEETPPDAGASENEQGGSTAEQAGSLVVYGDSLASVAVGESEAPVLDKDSVVGVGESGSEDQFSQPSCLESSVLSPPSLLGEAPPKNVCIVDSPVMCGQAQLSLEEQSRKACDLYGK